MLLEENIACRIRCLNCWNRWSWNGIDTRPTKLHELMTWHCITLYCCITMTAGKSLTQLAIRINRCINSPRHPIYLKVLLAWVRIVNTLNKDLKKQKYMYQVSISGVIKHFYTLMANKVWFRTVILPVDRRIQVHMQHICREQKTSDLLRNIAPEWDFQMYNQMCSCKFLCTILHGKKSQSTTKMQWPWFSH